MRESELTYAEGAVETSLPVGGSLKRSFDFSIALIALIALAPLMLTIILIIRLSDGSPAVYSHTRIGRNGRPFRCLKFRTMIEDSDRLLMQHLAMNEEAAREWRATRKLKDDPRVTPLGRVLRQRSIDELPQLINVLKGEMSIVGPRPIVAQEITYYGPFIADYYRARPGLTGLWQISGRNDVVYAERVRLDRDYVRNWTVWKDIVIVARTIPAVLSTRGCY